MYTLHIDQEKNFECSLKVQGASIKKSTVNLVVESADMDFKFKGKIDDNGKVTIPIRKLKHVLEDGAAGSLYLEVIAEDTYFVPFKSEYITEISKKVEFVESVVKPAPISKPTVTMISSAPSTKTGPKVTTPKQHANRLIKQLIENKLSLFRPSDQKKIRALISKYVLVNNIVETNLAKQIIGEIINPRLLK